MAASPRAYDVALEVVRSAKLPHPDGPLLECFLEESIDHDEAARYLLRRCSGDSAGLGVFLSDWKQLVSTCEYPAVSIRSVVE
jgi:hypothetical protein